MRQPSQFSVSRGFTSVMRKRQGGPGSVRLRFGDGTVQAVPVFGSGGSSAKRVSLCISVQFNRKGRFRFRFRFLEKWFRRFRFRFRFREIRNGKST